MGITYIRAGSALIKDGKAQRTWGVVRNSTAAGAGQGLVFDAGGAITGSTNKDGGNAIIKGGVATGSGSSGVELWGATAGAGGTTDRAAALLATLNAAGLSFKGEAARSVGMARHTTANTAGLGFTVDAGGATSAATDKAGGDLTLKSGISTGSGASSILLQVPTAGGAGTADRTPATVVTVAAAQTTFDQNIKHGGTAARTVGMNRNTTANTAGQGYTVDAGGATSGATDKAGGNLVLKAGISTGSADASILLQVPTAGGAGTADRTPATVVTVAAAQTTFDQNIKHGGTAARTVGMDRNTTADTAGQGYTVDAGGATSGATDKAGGDLVLSAGIATGTGTANVVIKATTAGGAGTADRTPATVATFAGALITLAKATSLSDVLDVTGQADFAGGFSLGNATADFVFRALTVKIVNNAGVLSTEVLTAAGDNAPEQALYAGMDSTVTALEWTITTGAHVGTFVVAETITGGTSAVTAVVTAVDGPGTTLRIKTWTGLAWTAGETLTGGTSGATTTFTSIAGYANAHGFLTGIATRATDENLYFSGTNANNVAKFSGTFNVGYNDTDTDLNVAFAARGATPGWALTLTNGASGAGFLINTTNFSASEFVRLEGVIFARA